MADLEVEAKEQSDYEHGEYPLMRAARWKGMEVAIERIVRAWPGAVNAQDRKDGGTALIRAAVNGSADNVHTLATMGTDLSIVASQGLTVFNVNKISPGSTPAQKAAIVKVLAKHGVTSASIPRHYQSPLYFSSIYYASNVRTQRWMNRKELLLCLHHVFNWSVENQIEAQVHRTLPSALSGVGRFVAHCFFDVAGGELGNGIARLITEFYGGFDESKSPHALIGVPSYGNVADTVARCSWCIQQPIKNGLLKCCGSTRYCSKPCQKAHFQSHKISCQSKAVAAKRAEVTARVAALQADMNKRAA
jgi:hypothetical protein